MTRNKKKFIFVLLLIVGVVSLYLPGLGGAFYYDDYSNLKGLVDINDQESFWGFIRSGMAGPLGRPISLLTFAVQHSAWPNNGASLFAVNIAIHACNAALVFLVACQLHRLAGESPQHEIEFALIAATFWMCSPILASSSLILIQRMTTLTAFFMLFAMLIYLKAFDWFRASPDKRLVFQALILGGGTLLATFSKENGVLLPSLMFAVEVTLLRNNENAKEFRQIRLLALGSSILVFLIYLSPLARPWFVVDGFRGFSSWERLQGEFVILWRYIYLIFFPKVAHFGPFQDQHTLTKDTIKVMASGLGVAFVLGGGFLFRKKYHWAFFGVLWFFIGQLLESTTILLEPYYEHRNYIPLIGLSLLFASLALTLIKKISAVWKFAVYGYILVNASILLLITSLWGKPIEAAKFWVETNPGSVRAVVHQVNLSLASNAVDVAANNEAAIQLNKIVAAMQLLDRTIDWCENCLSVRLQALAYSCIVEKEDNTRYRIKIINENLSKKQSRVNDAAIDGTAMLARLILENKCTSVKYSDIDQIIDQMLVQDKDKVYSKLLSKLYYQRATLAYAESRYLDAEKYITRADESWPEAEPVIEYQIEYYIQMNEDQKAINLIEKKIEQNDDGKIHLSVNFAKTLKIKLDEIKHDHQHSSSGKK